MQSPLTLHDFVLNLISDADARAAFDLDPDGSLRAAGLGDVTPADVRDVLPLVADYVPAHVAGLDTSLPEFASSALGADRTGIAQPLQFVTSQVPLQAPMNDPTLVAAGSLGSVATGATGLVGAAPVMPGALHGAAFSGGAGACGSAHVSGGAGVSGSAGASGGTDVSGGAGASGGAGLSGHFSPAQDPAGTLDAGLSGATGGLTGAVGGLGDEPVGHLTGVLDTATHGLTATTSGLTGVGSHPLDSGHVLDHTGLTGGLPVLNGAPGLLPGAGPLGLGATGDASGSAHAGTDPHLLDVAHLF